MFKAAACCRFVRGCVVLSMAIASCACYAESVQVNADPEYPNAGAVVTSVIPAGGNRYSVAGIALDKNGNSACALALASGRCMFTCGPGSLRCEGGTADLPFGEFALTDLATEADGTIVLQIFVQEHISYTETLLGAP